MRLGNVGGRKEESEERYLGYFGTVWGILGQFGAFFDIGESGESRPKIMGLVVVWVNKGTSWLLDLPD